MIAVDTAILIWGVRKARPADRPDLVERCIELLADYKRQRLPIMMPSIVLTQYLLGHSGHIEESRKEIQS